MAEKKNEDIAYSLFEAERSAKAVKRFTAAAPNFSLNDAYVAQAALLGLHKKAGAALVGRKMGMTSRPKMLQMGIHNPIHGFLTDRMQVVDGGTLSVKDRIHPKAEPEIAFVLGKELRGKVSPEEALAAIAGVAGAIEVIDSRYENFDFGLADVVADNCSSSGFVLGPTLKKPAGLDLANLGIVLEQNGKPVQFGSSAAILGHPVRALTALVEMLEATGDRLPAGSVVLAGAATAAVAIQAGDSLRARFQGLGSVEFRVEA